MLKALVITILTAAFLGVFFARNLLVRARIGKPVQFRTPLVRLSILLSTLIFTVANVSLWSEDVYRLAGPLPFLNTPVVYWTGVALFAAGLILQGIASHQLRDSWRVGFLKDERTDLIQTGLYRRIRNPYFLAYFMVFFAVFLSRPSGVLFLLMAPAIGAFHTMVLQEERHLSLLHGDAYKAYRRRTGRYLPKIYATH